MMEVTVSGQERRRLVAARAVSPEVYESYLKGRFALNKNGPVGLKEAIAHFEDAIHREPTFAPAFAGLGIAYSDLGTVFIGASPLETRPKVLAAAKKALELDPELVEAHVVLASALQKEWRWGGAEAGKKQSLELSSREARARNAIFARACCYRR